MHRDARMPRPSCAASCFGHARLHVNFILVLCSGGQHRFHSCRCSYLKTLPVEVEVMQDHKLHSPHGRAPTTTGLRRGRNSHAPHGNFLEAINLALDVFDEEHIERNPPGGFGCLVFACTSQTGRRGE